MSKSTAVVNQTINAAVSASDPATTPRKRAKQLARWRHTDGVAMAMHSNQTRSWASLRVSSEILA
jgi:uncharacterized protein YdaU (DUF1376 family)